MLSLSGTSATRTNFASSIAGSPVCMATGADGNLYFLSRTNSAVYKITYSNSGMPAITNQPQSITIAQGNTASFSVTATGAAPLTYQWKKNGVNISGATNAAYEIQSVAFADSGNYSVVVSNAAGSVTSNNATLKVTAPNTIPIAEINTPGTGATYAGGDVINFSGSGSDSEDGTLATSAFNWFILFHHGTHTHPGPAVSSGVTSGSFTVPNTGETSTDVFYRLYLVVTDSKGAKDTTYTDILPRTSVITLNTNPPGLQVTLDGQPFAAPVTVTSVEGVLRTIGVVTAQGSYTFSNWSQGGNATQTVATPVNDATYTANFTQNQNVTLTPLADAFVQNGSYAGTNYGKDTSLIVKASNVRGYTRTSYLQFSLGTLSNNITSAKLRIYGRNAENTTSISVSSYGLDNDAWTETGITFNNAPAASTTALSSAAVNNQARYYELDVTNYVKTQYSTDKKVSFLIKSPTNQNKKLVFNSRENARNQPQLIIVSAANRSNNTSSNELPIVAPGNFGESLKDVKIPVVYPNPTEKRFNIRFPANYEGRFLLDIVNEAGIVYKLGEPRISAGGSNINIDISKFSLQPGVYFLRINSNERHNQIKLVIQ
ncbi:MAG TPA: DNRLRE domain-containing protein [Segetibacter sp.]|nr:DNRLRE domain-containing protein [Segetibacter sp.]